MAMTTPPKRSTNFTAAFFMDVSNVSPTIVTESTTAIQIAPSQKFMKPPAKRHRSYVTLAIQ